MKLAINIRLVCDKNNFVRANERNVLLKEIREHIVDDCRQTSVFLYPLNSLIPRHCIDWVVHADFYLHEFLLSALAKKNHSQLPSFAYE